MILEHVSAEKSTYSSIALRPKPIQLLILPKNPPHPDYRVSFEQIERIPDKMSAVV